MGRYGWEKPPILAPQREVALGNPGGPDLGHQNKQSHVM